MQTLIEKIDQGQLWQFPGGIHPAEQKQLSNTTAIATLPLPETFWVPVRQHVGHGGSLLVKPGDTVLKGQALTSSDNPMLVPVHAPTSGTVGRIESRPMPHPSGLSELAIEVIADGQDHWRPRQARINVDGLERDEILHSIRMAGIAGLGGATFPTTVKLGGRQSIRFLLINGAECEPYISSDDRLMREHATEICQGVEILSKLVQPERILIGIEDNKPEAIAAMEQALAQSHLDKKITSVRSIPTKYPSGSEKQLIQILTGQEVPKGQLPADVGLLMHNVGTCYAIKRALLDDEPLIERVVTVTGEQAGRPGNYWLRLGTDIQWVLQQLGSKPQAGQPLIMGGPMMGFALPSQNLPVVKATNCLLLPSKNEFPPAPAARNCIRCGECAQVCPQQLLPQQLFWHSQASEFDKAEKLNLFDCIECGACAFVCPSDIPLVHHYRIAKAELREQKEKAAKADRAKVRFDARQARLEKEKQERESRHKSAAQRAPKAADSAGVAAALERLKAKQGSLKPAPEAQPDMAELRRQRKAQARAAKAAQAAQAEQSAKPAREQAPASRQDAVAAAVARAKARKAEQQQSAGKETPAGGAPNAAVAAAVARAKAKKAAQQAAQQTEKQQGQPVDATADTPVEVDPRGAAVAAAVARAKAKKAAQQGEQTAESKLDAPAEADPRKAAVAAAVARAKAKKAAQQAEQPTEAKVEAPADSDPRGAAYRKAAVAAAVARAKAKKAAQQAAQQAGQPAEQPAEAKVEAPVETDQRGAASRKAAVAAAVARAKAKKAAQQAAQQTEKQPGQPIETKAEPVHADTATPANEASAAAEQDPRKAAVARAIAKAKARKQQQRDDNDGI